MQRSRDSNLGVLSPLVATFKRDGTELMPSVEPVETRVYVGDAISSLNYSLALWHVRPLGTEMLFVEVRTFAI